MPKKPRKMPKRARERIDELIANAKTPLEQRRLAYYGPKASDRDQPLVRLALSWRALRSDEAARSDLKSRDALYRQAKSDLECVGLGAMWGDKPEVFEALADAMRRVSRGEFDPNIDRDRAEILDRVAQGELNVAELARKLASSTKDPKKDPVGSKERALRRIKARMRPKYPDK